MKRLAAIAGALALATAIAMPAQAETTLRITLQLPLKSHLGQNLVMFKDEVEKESEGDIKVEIYDSAQLYKDNEVPQAVGSGSIEMGVATLTRYVGEIPAVDIFYVPFMFNSDAKVRAAVAPGSAADRAGLKAGDIVLSFNGRPVTDSGALAAMVGEAKPGDEAKLEILRKGDHKQLVATLGASNDESTQSASVGDEEEHAQLGLAVRPLTPEERKAVDVPGGLVVEGVNGAAARAGVAPGDIVLQAGGKPVRTVEDLRAAAKSGKTVALLVQRGERRLFVPLQAG